nr:8557_t:CDS:2 [Entrophospora candida]
MPKPNKRQIHIAKLAQNKRRSSDPTHVDNVPNTNDDDMNMNKIENFTIVNNISIKSRPFYMGNSIRTQQRRSKVLRDAAIGSSKITDFFNSQTPNRYQSVDDDKGDDWKNRIDSVEEALRNPDLDNGAKSRLTAIGMYFRNLDDGKKKVEASEIVAVSLGWTKNYKSKCIRAWAKQWIRNNTVPTSMRGKHPKIQSLWNHEDIAAQVGSYIRSNKFDITPKNLCEHVNGTILPNIGVDNEDKKISESTAARWLRRLGWKFV